MELAGARLPSPGLFEGERTRVSGVEGHARACSSGDKDADPISFKNIDGCTDRGRVRGWPLMGARCAFAG